MIKLIKWLYNNNQQFEYTPAAFKMQQIKCFIIFNGINEYIGFRILKPYRNKNEYKLLINEKDFGIKTQKEIIKCLADEIETLKKENRI